MEAYSQSASPSDASYVKKLISTVKTVEADYQKVAE
jgi:hypothetical protein